VSVTSAMCQLRTRVVCAKFLFSRGRHGLVTSPNSNHGKRLFLRYLQAAAAAWRHVFIATSRRCGALEQRWGGVGRRKCKRRRREL